MKIGIVNISLGNVGSVQSAFEFYGQEVLLLDSPKELAKADVLVLAGVGNFVSAAGKMDRAGFTHGLQEQVMGRGKPILGICLGMHLFADVSFEDGETKGFGWIPGEVRRIEGKGLRTPHMGWNQVVPSDPALFDRMRYNFFYFMHSYHFVPKDETAVIARTGYGDLNLVSALRQDNIFGVQFHPEKSQGDGLRFLRNFLEEIK